MLDGIDTAPVHGEHAVIEAVEPDVVYVHVLVPSEYEAATA